MLLNKTVLPKADMSRPEMSTPREVDLTGSNDDVARWIWKTLVPKSGQASYVQAEVLRAIEKLRWDLSGFHPEEDWAVAELWHDDGTLWRVKKPFGTYIREQMLMGPNGVDLRKR